MPEQKTNSDQELQSKDRYKFASEKSKRQIFFDNLTGGIAWGVGSILGATIIVGVLGFLIVRSRQIPFVGDIVQVVVDEINQGRNSTIFNPQQSTTTPPPTPTSPEPSDNSSDNNVTSYPQ